MWFLRIRSKVAIKKSQGLGWLSLSTLGPFPEHLAKAKLKAKFGKFLDVLKRLKINISFLDVIFDMSSYAKFLKEILSNKWKIQDYAMVSLTEECSAILQNKLPPKLEDPRSFSVPHSVGMLA